MWVRVIVFWFTSLSFIIRLKMTYELGKRASTMELHCTLHTSMNPPLSFTYIYSRNRSRGFLEIVGHVVMGVRRSSMNASNLSNQIRLSGLSSISYNFPRLSVFCKTQQMRYECSSTIYNTAEYYQINIHFVQERINLNKNWQRSTINKKQGCQPYFCCELKIIFQFSF